MKLNTHSIERERKRRGRSRSARSILSRGSQRKGKRPALVELDLPSLEGQSILRIVRPAAGHSIRTGMSGTSVTTQAFYTSIRTGTSLPVEGETERIGVMIDEVVTDRIRCHPQPFRIELVTPAGTYISIPDRARLLADGRWQIVEAKSDWRGFEKKSAQQQGILGKLAADALGADYVREVRANLGSPIFIDNVELVQSYRFIKPTMTQEATVTRMLAAKPVLSLGEIASALHPIPANGFATACSMMVRRNLSIDLDRKLSRDSLVRSIRPPPPFMPGLFDALPPLARAA